jgi:hypothetical protein
MSEHKQKERKTFLDYTKEWAGVLSLAVSLVYTFPLGVWDRFYVAAEQKRETDIETVRELLVKLTQLDSEAAQKNAATNDQNQKQYNLGSTFSSKAAMLMKEMPKVKANYAALTTPELAALAYELGTLGQGLFSEVVYEAALNKARSENDAQAVAGLYSTRSLLYSQGGAIGLDLQKARNDFANAVKAWLTLPINPGRLGATTTVMQWAGFEMGVGQKSCARELFDGGLPIAQNMNPMWAEQVRGQLAQLRDDRGADGPEQITPCPKEILPWQLFGWPWPEKGSRKFERQ